MSGDRRGAEQEWTVAANEAGVRLDKFLADPTRVGSRARAASALERGKIFVNGEEVEAGDGARRIVAGDVVRLWVDRPGSSRARREPTAIGDLGIVYEDEDLFVVDKPAGLLTVPLDRRPLAPSAYDLLRDHVPKRQRRLLGVVHRIDEYTSGLIVFARHPLAQERLKDQFRRRTADRVYWAVVYGHPDPAEGTWRDHLVWDERAMVQKETHPHDPQGKAAISHYRTLEGYATASLIEVRLETGKRNQIRLQARLRGHTLVGEQRYVYGPEALRPIAFWRQALHARSLTFAHPRDGRPLQFESPVPRDMSELIDRLRRGTP
jgi:23S rRNA pseudouridine1911/1915/1917 synthase